MCIDAVSEHAVELQVHEPRQPGLGLDPDQLELEVEVAHHHQVAQAGLEDVLHARAVHALLERAEQLLAAPRQLLVELDQVGREGVLHHLAFEEFGEQPLAFGVPHFEHFERQHFALEPFVLQLHALRVALHQDRIFEIDAALESVRLQQTAVLQELPQILDHQIALLFRSEQLQVVDHLRQPVLRRARKVVRPHLLQRLEHAVPHPALVQAQELVDPDGLVETRLVLLEHPVADQDSFAYLVVSKHTDCFLLLLESGQHG